LILLDANALIALLRDEPAASEVERLLHARECATPASCLTEVVDRLIRRSAVSPEEIVDRVEPLIQAKLAILPVENRLAWWAGELRGVHYARGDVDLSLADCLLLAAAEPEDELATSDGAVARVAHALDIDVIPLPDSSGRRPDLT
jgi:predicted nucleic acid-binding protein